jgi:hypothetical protein
VKYGTICRGLKNTPQRKSQKYTVGASVTVLVNTPNTQMSVLEPGGDRLFMPMMVTIGGLFFVFGLTKLFSLL